MNKSIGSFSSSDLIDAKLEERQMCRSKQCPGCGHKLERKPDWLGLPAGVKFDPTDQELIEHLEAQVEDQDTKSHPLIDEFIPTIEGEDGICYTHPEKLPGVTRDGLSKHFFHRPSKAYTTGTRKRRKIQSECDLQGGETRWHKTGKTRPVAVNGEHEEEKEGELVVSKIFYQTQPRQSYLSERTVITGEGSLEKSSRRESGSGSCSSSKEICNREEFSGAGAAMSSYNTIDIQQLKSDHFSFAPLRKSFDEVGVEEVSRGGETSNLVACKDHEEQGNQRTRHVIHEQQQQPQHHQVSTAAFHVSRPSHPISTIISPPLHHLQTSIVLDQESYNVSRMILQNENFQQQQQQQHKMGERSSSGLEEMLMGCTSSDTKEESSITNPQEAGGS
ncbi:hypothetical protein GIB67_028749 [Kingdonia uniflora]|uniref:NAC domain-containing protein n=1 Tax=Kingdonia uniflora TaxID=39325 RepID=A0A7J7NQ87_9MAGN|nr:hypothetical protein GIB67_028749 [Kingdonia uniflora]